MFGASRGLVLRTTIQLLFLLGTAVATTVLLLFGVQAASGQEILLLWPVTPVGVVALVIVGGCISAMLAAFGGYWLSWSMVRELDDLRIGVRLLAEGRLQHRWSQMGIREARELKAQLNRMAEKWEKQVALLQSLAEEKELLAEKARGAGVSEERQRLARELHDAVSQQLFALSMTTAAVNRLIDQDPAKAKVRLAAIEKMAHTALGEMRALLMHLRPVQLGDETLQDTVAGMLDELNQKGIVHCTYDIQADLELSRSIESNVLRIIQEAVANTLRHAQAKNLEVRLVTGHQALRVTVEDDGVGFDVAGPTDRKVSYGLKTMEERVGVCGGTLNIISVPGRGTRIDIRIPLTGNFD